MEKYIFLSGYIPLAFHIIVLSVIIKLEKDTKNMGKNKNSCVVNMLRRYKNVKKMNIAVKNTEAFVKKSLYEQYGKYIWMENLAAFTVLMFIVCTSNIKLAFSVGISVAVMKLYPAADILKEAQNNIVNYIDNTLDHRIDSEFTKIQLKDHRQSMKDECDTEKINEKNTKNAKEARYTDKYKQTDKENKIRLSSEESEIIDRVLKEYLI